MPKLFGVNIADILNRALSPGMFTGYLLVGQGGARNPNDPTAGITFEDVANSSFQGIVNTYRDDEIDNESVLREDRKILIIAESIDPPTVPAVGMKIDMSQDHLGGQGFWTIVRVTRDPAHATYVCQGRL
jgi:hypothetical protein